jgi:hypothetical protein
VPLYHLNLVPKLHFNTFLWRRACERQKAKAKATHKVINEVSICLRSGGKHTSEISVSNDDIHKQQRAFLILRRAKHCTARELIAKFFILLYYATRADIISQKFLPRALQWMQASFPLHFVMENLKNSEKREAWMACHRSITVKMSEVWTIYAIDLGGGSERRGMLINTQHSSVKLFPTNMEWLIAELISWSRTD